jgi:hypothetical protein
VRLSLLVLFSSLPVASRADVTPPTLDRPQPSTVEFETRWPRTLPCKPTRVFLQADAPVDVEWRGPRRSLHFSLRNTRVIDGVEGHRTGPIADVPIDGDFPVGELDTVRVIGRLRAAPDVALKCGGGLWFPGAGEVLWYSSGGSRGLAVSRTIDRKFPVGERYLGRGGWDCVGDCGRGLDLAAWIASPARRPVEVMKLGRDLAAEAENVLDQGCGDACSALARRALDTLRGFVAGNAHLATVDLIHPTDDGWSAELAGANGTRLAAQCRRTLPNPRDLNVHCFATLSRDGVFVLRYYAGRRNGVDGAFVQAIELGDHDRSAGRVEIETGSPAQITLYDGAIAMKPAN